MTTDTTAAATPAANGSKSAGGARPSVARNQPLPAGVPLENGPLNEHTKACLATIDAARLTAKRDVDDYAYEATEKAAAYHAEKKATPKIHAAIVAVMRDIDAIGKDKTAMGYKFRGIDDVYNELHSHLAKHGVYTVPEVLDERSEERTTGKGSVLIYRIMKIRFTFFALDGSSVAAVVIGEGMDSGDKASNKAMSVAHKYAFIQVFAIPTKDDKDPEVPGAADERNSGGIKPRGAPPPRSENKERELKTEHPAAAPKTAPAPHPVNQAASAAAVGAGGRKRVAMDLQNPKHCDWLNGELDRMKIMDSVHRDRIGELMSGKFGDELPGVIDLYMNPPQEGPTNG